MGEKRDGFEGQKAIVIPDDIRQTLRNNELTRNLYITDIGYYPKAEGHYRHRNNGCNQNILIYCHDGEGWYSIDNIKHPVKPNDFFVIEAGVPHTYAASQGKPWSIYWFHFTGLQSHLFSNLFNQTTRIENASTERYEERLLLFEEIYQNLEMGYNIENLQYVTTCLWHLMGSFRYIPQFREVKKLKPTDTVQKTISFMKANLEKQLTIEDIARCVLYSPSYLSSLFKNKTGINLIDYFNRLKIQKSCQYLDFSDMKIKEIAYKMGFSDPYYFSKVFTKYMNMSPMEYKKKKKG
ncbi:MAG: AraC family transcriptional regulator [Bacteroidaceae bacterium]|nr:AraC family transcriptional regulator [Bacteroidaceae bacterium]